MYVDRKIYLKFRRKDILRLYPKTNKVYGPYLNKRTNRYTVVLYSTTGYRRSIQFSKLKMEIQLGIRIHEPDTVDHLDENCSNDDLKNYQILTRSNNTKKSHLQGACTSKYIIKHSRSKLGRSQSKLRLIENNPCSIFPRQHVVALREKYATGRISKERIMEKYNAQLRSVRDMLQGIHYADLPKAMILGYGMKFLRFKQCARGEKVETQGT